MRVSLEVQSGPQSGRFITVPHGAEVIVGRKAPAQFLVEGDLTLSRAHFALSCAPPRCLLRDLGSTGGTLLNGTPVAEAGVEVKDRDVIEAGSTFLVVRIDARAPSAPLFVPARPTAPGEDDRESFPTETIPTIDVRSIPDRVLKRLREDGEPLFAILDAARDPLVLVKLMSGNETYQSLYEGVKGERLAAAAPYLVALPPRSPFLETLVLEGWGRSWGVYLRSRATFAELRKHLRRFLLVRIEKGPEVYFRYYDPRVLRTFLPTCERSEALDFFGPIRAFFLEGLDPGTYLEFERDGPAAADRVRPIGLAVPADGWGLTKGTIARVRQAREPG